MIRVTIHGETVELSAPDAQALYQSLQAQVLPPGTVVNYTHYSPPFPPEYYQHNPPVVLPS